MSHSIKRILFATDFSEGASHAQDQAIAWSRAIEAELQIVHVLELHPSLDPTQPVNKMYLDQLRAQAAPKLEEIEQAVKAVGVTANVRVEFGIPSQVIVRTAEELDTDLIVLGTRGLSGLEHLLVGSTAERVIRSSPCPVLAVHAQQAPPGHEPVRERSPSTLKVQSILVPVDFSDCSLDALEFAIFVAGLHKAAMTILHVPEPITFGIDFTLRHVEERREWRRRTETWLSDIAKLLAGQGLATETRLITGQAADTILSCARDSQVDLIVMGTHGRRGLSHAFTGSVMEAVLRRAASPVLAVKSPKFTSGHRRVLPEQQHRIAVGELKAAGGPASQ